MDGPVMDERKKVDTGESANSHRGHTHTYIMKELEGWASWIGC